MKVKLKNYEKFQKKAIDRIKNKEKSLKRNSIISVIFLIILSALVAYMIYLLLDGIYMLGEIDVKLFVYGLSIILLLTNALGIFLWCQLLKVCINVIKDYKTLKKDISKLDILFAIIKKYKEKSITLYDYDHITKTLWYYNNSDTLNEVKHIKFPLDLEIIEIDDVVIAKNDDEFFNAENVLNLNDFSFTILPRIK